MKNKPFLAIAGLILSSLFVSRSAAEISTNDWKPELLTALKAHYEITQRDAFFGKIKKVGTLLTIVQDGLKADERKLLLKSTTIEDGKIIKSGGGDILTGVGGRTLKPGEKVYVLDIRVHDDHVTLEIAAVNTVDVIRNGKTRSIMQETSVAFRFGHEDSRNAEKIIAMIMPWLATEAELASTKTIALGQTMDEVTKALGQPTKIAKLDPKTIYFYPDMKVIFVDGKVTDIQ